MNEHQRQWLSDFASGLDSCSECDNLFMPFWQSPRVVETLCNACTWKADYALTPEMQFRIRVGPIGALLAHLEVEPLDGDDQSLSDAIEAYYQRAELRAARPDSSKS